MYMCMYIYIYIYIYGLLSSFRYVINLGMEARGSGALRDNNIIAKDHLQRPPRVCGVVLLSVGSSAEKLRALFPSGVVNTLIA